MDPETPRLRLLPVHDLPREAREVLGVRRGKGRPRQIVCAPDADTYLEVVDAERQASVPVDPVVVATASNPERLLDVLIHEAAIEAAAIAFECRRAEGEGRDIGQHCSRRIDGLLHVARLVTQRERQRHEVGEPKAEAVEKVRKIFLDSVEAVATATLSAELAVTVMDRIRMGISDTRAEMSDDEIELPQG